MDEILTRWANGEGAGLIAKRFRRTGVNGRQWIYKVVAKARQAGDPRALRHTDAKAGQPLWRQRFKREGRNWVFNEQGVQQ